jgi:hypothetical protein
MLAERNPWAGRPRAWISRAVAILGISAAVGTLTAGPAVAETGVPVPLNVSIVVPLTVPERSTGLLDAELLASYTSPFGLLTRQLDQVVDRPVTLAIDPMIIVSIRVLGAAAPVTATDWLTRLAAAGNETFALSWADADLTAALQAGAQAVPQPEDFAFAIDPGQFAPAEPTPTVPPSPAPTPTETTEPPEDGALPAFPTTESLLAWNYTVPSIAWPASNSVTSSDLQAMSTQHELALISSGNVSPTGSRASIDAAQLLVSDDPLSTLFSTTVASSGLEWQTGLASLTAAISGVPSFEGDSSVIITLNRGVRSSDSDLGATIDSIASSANVRAVGLGSVIALDAVPATLVDQPQDEARVATVAGLLEQERLDRIFAQVAATPTLLTSERRLALLATLGNGWRNNTVGWELVSAEFSDDSVALRDSVKIVKSSDITLWADRGSLPVTVANELAQAVTVFVRVRPLTPLLNVEDSFYSLTIEPASQRRAQVPVQSLSNGTVELNVSLHRADGGILGEMNHVRTTVQAGWETPFTIAIQIFVVLVFVFGIVRNILRRRAARARAAE